MAASNHRTASGNGRQRMFRKARGDRRPRGKAGQGRKEYGNHISRSLAIHEAGHAVAHWYTGSRFHRVLVRTSKERKTGPYVDRRGREDDSVGMVETGRRFNALSHVTGQKAMDIKWPGTPAEARLILERQRAAMEIEVIHCLAGPIADARYNHQSLAAVYYTKGITDFEQARQNVDEFTRTREERAECLDRLERKTKAILRKPGVWKAVESLAAALQEKHALEWDEAIEIISRETGEGVRPYDTMWPDHLKQNQKSAGRLDG